MFDPKDKLLLIAILLFIVMCFVLMYQTREICRPVEHKVPGGSYFVTVCERSL